MPGILDIPVNENEAVVMVAGFIFSLKVTDRIWVIGTPTAKFVGTVDTTIGHTPVLSTKLSFLHPDINAIDTIANAANSLSVFIFLILVIKDFYHTNLMSKRQKSLTQFQIKIV
jgi:hypothetical protein